MSANNCVKSVQACAKEVWLCPSAQPGLNGSLMFGVVEDHPDGRRVSYLDHPARVTDGTIFALASSSVKPTEFLRFAAPCAQGGCHNWSGSKCSVAERLVQILPAKMNELQTCMLRPRCRWFREQGEAACVRCLHVVTGDPALEAALTQVAPSNQELAPTRSAVVAESS